MKKCFAGLIVLGAIVSYGHAQGGPPLITDDPGTVAKGKWEVNVAWINRTFRNRTENEVPHFDANFGLSNRAHFKVEIPWVFATQGGKTISGDGGGSIGIKYRFLDGTESRPAISTYPQLGFSLDPRSVRMGLSEGGTSLLLPLQIEWDRKAFNTNADGGIVLQSGTAPGWIGGLAIGRDVGGCELLAEIHGEGVFATAESNWIAQLGLRREFGEAATLLFAFGKSVASHNSEAQRWTSYLGLQLHF